MKKKILVLGSTGMLGHQVVNHLLDFDNYDIFDIAYRLKLREKTVIVDVTDKALIEKIVIKMIKWFDFYKKNCASI